MSFIPPVRIDHDCLGRLELLPRLQLPVKPFRIDPEEHSRRIMCVYFCLREEISTVDQAESDHFSLKLIRSWTLQDDKRIVLMG